MKIKVEAVQTSIMTVLGIKTEWTKIDQMIADSYVFICLWSKGSPDDIQIEQLKTALYLNKPFFLIIQEGAEKGDYFNNANIIFEIEYKNSIDFEDKAKIACEKIAEYVKK